MTAVILHRTSQLTYPRCGINAGGGKHSGRLLSSLSTAPDASRLIRKFVASSSKSTALQTLSFLISHSSPFSLHFYQTISDCAWYQWNPKLTACLISLLEEHHRSLDAQTLISQSASGLRSPCLALFYCDLIDAFSDRGLRLPALRTYALLKEIPFTGRRLYGSMVRGMCLMGMPADAEEFLREMGLSGFNPSPLEYRMLIQSYGRVGAFAEMKRVLELMEEIGMALDTVCANIMLSCYGDHGKFSEMVAWIHKMRETDIGFSVRTFNSVLNSSPAVMMIMKDTSFLPLSIDAFFKKVEEESHCPDEPLLLRELAKFPLIATMVDWSDSDVKLDLHGLHLATAYLVILMWMEEVRSRFVSVKDVPKQISIICGSGKHSKMRGDSPVKKLVSVMMFHMKSPLMLDRKNVGKFVAKGKSVRDWLC